MKAVILAGGYGTRISEESHLLPKPMIEIGGKPILWHIMKIYSAYKIDDFVICLGYKGEKIKEYFGQFDSKLWNIQLVDTGLDTMTGGRLKRITKSSMVLFLKPIIFLNVFYLFWYPLDAKIHYV